MARTYDAVIVGAGHNGLVSAAYLAKAGRSVLVLEARDIVGGACVTEELIPGYQFSSCAFLFGLFRPQIIRDLELGKFGYEAYSVDPSAVGVFENGKTLTMHGDLDKTLAEIRKFSKRDVEGFLDFGIKLQRFANLVEPWLLKPPPTRAELEAVFSDAASQVLFDEFTSISIADLLARHFESPEVRGFFSFLAMVSIFAGPNSPGTSYQYAHHAMGEFEGNFGTYGFVRGGLGGATQALASCAGHFGAEIRTGVRVQGIRVRRGVADGVVLDSGEEINAKVVLSNVDPKTLFTDLVGLDSVSHDIASMVKNFDTRGTMARVHIASSQAPLYTAFGHTGLSPEHRGHQLIGPSEPAFQAAWEAQQLGELPERFVIELVMQSAHDSSLTPLGHHAISLGVQNLPYELNGGWRNRSDEFGRKVVAQLIEYAPNLKDSILDFKVISPLDLQETWSLPTGNIFHGAQSGAQLFSHRPFPGWSRYRMPVRNLYLCGAGAHPGGGVTGAPGHNAAMEVLRDLADPIQSEDEWIARAATGTADLLAVSGQAALGIHQTLWRYPALRGLATKGASNRLTRPIVRRLLKTKR
ncbi:MAG: NAD(P)/FAD-dependent oxidoreductase [Actinomycetes bacterium]